jgi:uncharacterized membrane protein YfcA
MKEFLFLAVVLVSNVFQAITGFAGTVLAMPVAIRLIGADQAKFVLNIVAWISGIMIAASGYRDIQWKELGKAFAFMAIGMVAGIQIYEMCSLRYLLPLYGAVIILISLHKFFRGERKKRKLPKTADYVLLFLAGIMHGMFVSGGPLAVIAMSDDVQNQKQFRVTISSLWVVLDLIIFASQMHQHQLTGDTFRLTLASVIPLGLAVWIGIRIAGKISKKRFMNLTCILLMISGITMII